MIHRADCRTHDWSDLPDVMVTDPPYDPHVHKSVRSMADRGKNRRDLGFDPVTDELRAWTCQMAAVVRRWSVIFTDIESVGAWRDGLGQHYVRAIPWVRWSMPQLTGDRPPQGCEMVVVAWGSARGKKSWNGPGNLTHLAHKCLRGDGKHPTEKPLDLLLDLLTYFSDLGELVIDPFAGSGTTGVAARILQRRFEGTELDPKWAEAGQARMYRESMSGRDHERVARWLETEKVRKSEMSRLEQQTERLSRSRGPSSSPPTAGGERATSAPDSSPTTT